MKQIESERLILRNFNESDYQDYIEFMKMEEISFRMGINENFQDGEIENKFKKALKEDSCFAIELKGNSTVIGQVCVTKDEGNAEALNINSESSCNVNYLINKHFCKL